MATTGPRFWWNSILSITQAVPVRCDDRRVFREGDTFIVLLGRDVQHGIVGLGNTVENALRAFDLQYLSMLSPRGRVVQGGRSHGLSIDPDCPAGLKVYAIGRA
jgi:hypothetical protein